MLWHVGQGMEGKFALVNGLNGSVPVLDGDDVVLAGFGATDGGGNTGSPVLREVTVKKRSRAFCRQQNPSADRNSWINFDHVICTGGDAGKDSCNGDSGGPAVAMRDGKAWLVGVLSIGSELPKGDQSCGALGRLGVYTAVDQFSNWIHAVIHNQAFCCTTCPCPGLAPPTNASVQQAYGVTSADPCEPTTTTPAAGTPARLLGTPAGTPNTTTTTHAGGSPTRLLGTPAGTPPPNPLSGGPVAAGDLEIPAPAPLNLTLTVTMGYSRTEFDADKQTRYKAAMASAGGGTSEANVVILSINDNRRTAAHRVAVETMVRAPDAAGLEKLRSTLGSGNTLKANIDRHLQDKGLLPSLAVSEVKCNCAGPGVAGDSFASSANANGYCNGTGYCLCLLLPIIITKFSIEVN